MIRWHACTEWCDNNFDQSNFFFVFLFNFRFVRLRGEEKLKHKHFSSPERVIATQPNEMRRKLFTIGCGFDAVEFLRNRDVLFDSRRWRWPGGSKIGNLGIDRRNQDENKKKKKHSVVSIAFAEGECGNGLDQKAGKANEVIKKVIDYGTTTTTNTGDKSRKQLFAIYHWNLIFMSKTMHSSRMLNVNNNKTR